MTSKSNVHVFSTGQSKHRLVKKEKHKGKKTTLHGVYIIMLGKAHQMNIGIGTCTVKNLFNVKIHEWYTLLFKLKNLKFFVCQL